VFERTVQRRRRREVLRRRKEKLLWEQEKKRREDEAALIASGRGGQRSSRLGARNLPLALSPNRTQQLKQQQMLHQLDKLERRYEAAQYALPEQQPRRPKGHRTVKSSPRRKYNSNGVDSSMLLHGGGHPRHVYPGIPGSRSIISNSLEMEVAESARAEQLRKDQQRMEKMVRSGQHRAEVLQKLEFDLLRAEFAGSMSSVSQQLAVLEDREAARGVHEDSLELTSKWWTQEEKNAATRATMPCNRNKPFRGDKQNGRRLLGDRSPPPYRDATLMLPPRDYEVKLARSKLQLLHAKAPRVSTNNTKSPMKQSSRRSPTRSDLYGSKKTTLNLFNEERRAAANPATKSARKKRKKKKPRVPAPSPLRSSGRRLYM